MYANCRMIMFVVAISVFLYAGMASAQENFTPAEKQPPTETPVSVKDAGNDSDCDVIEIRPGWWEEKRNVYNGIPARILFRLREGKAVEATRIAEKAWKEFDRMGEIVNPFNPNSEVGKLNAAEKTAPVVLSPELLALLRRAKTVYDASEGAFDVTLWPVKQVWRMARKKQEPPTAAELKAALDRSGFDKVQLPAMGRNEIMLKRSNMEFDFGGVAKGYAVDLVKGVLLASEVEAGLVQLGGEIAAFGNKDDNPWRIGVQHPSDDNDLWGVIEYKGSLNVSTSGNYRQPIVIKDKTYYHIFHPKTGQPVSEKVLGVTVVSINSEKESAILDSAATAITVLGSKKGIEFAKKLGVEALILVADKEEIKEYKTPGWDSVHKK